MRSQTTVRVAVVGDHDPTLVTHQALDRTIELLPDDVDCQWAGTSRLSAAQIAQADGVWIAPGSPYADDDAVVDAIQAARTTGIPLLATCGGFQHVAIEYVRNVLGLPADHGEVAPDSPQLAVTPLACSMVGVEEHVQTVAGTTLAAVFGRAPFPGFYFCSYGLNPALVPVLQDGGVVIAAHGEGGLVTGVELAGHPFFVATLFQPQMEVHATDRLPRLVAAWVSAARQRAARGGTHLIEEAGRRRT